MAVEISSYWMDDPMITATTKTDTVIKVAIFMAVASLVTFSPAETQTVTIIKKMIFSPGKERVGIARTIPQGCCKIVPSQKAKLLQPNANHAPEEAKSFA